MAEATMTRPDWDSYFLAIAQTVKTRADCTRRQVGCVIVKDRRIVSTGYNGAPAGEAGCMTAGACPRGQYDHSEVPAYTDYQAVRCIALHAEENALIYARKWRKRDGVENASGDDEWLTGAVAYVTEVPCDGCAAQLRGAGITRVVTPNEKTPPVPGGTVGTNSKILAEGV